MRTRSAVLLGVVVACLGVGLAPPRPAAAHAALVATTPVRDEVIGYTPREVVVTFTEAVSPVAGRVQVLAPDGRKINTGEPVVSGATMRIPVRTPDKPLGTYLVSYRVVSADSHPIAGSFAYSAGAPSATPPQPAADGSERSATALVAAAKYTGYLGLVLAVGPVLLLTTMWPRRRSRRAATILAFVGLGLIAAGAAGTWVGQAAEMVGASPGVLSSADLRAVAASDVGVVLGARLALVAVAVAVLPAVVRGGASRWRRLGMAAVGVAALATWPLAGHPVASPVPPVSVAVDVAHVAAMTVWLGGLLTLTVFLLRHTHERVLARILPAWSRWATLAVCWLVVTGLIQAAIELGRPAALLGTTYGRLLCAKAGLLVAVLAVAAWQRQMVRRRVAASRPRRVTRAAGVELAATAVVLGLSAVLVQTPPGRTADTDAARVARNSVAQTLTSDLYTLQFDVYPARVGTPSTLHAYLYTAQARALPAAEWTITLALPAAGIEPITVKVDAPEPNHASATLTFPTAGDWALKFTARTTDVDQATVTATVPVT
ncbi:copper resistance CopC/CopD family protein [Micromonospora sp. WMMC250]|uniref:copper resistance CopC/CopD family protein n=1 Tax=Micromonospora sp. WMMC250 TaxID=3014781 RepID=UPI0022B6713D|nr:copper resistance protein CopC [Micromonospora sp. WMMC250]MCZ7379814.1 copper resistance protein CopC [Micromonospora sp. WMMC250]